MTVKLGSLAPASFRVGSQPVTALYLGSTKVYDAADTMSAWSEHSVFGATAPPVTLTPHADLDTNGWTGSNFVLPYDQTGEWELVGGRLYIPSNMGDEISFPFPVKMGYAIRNQELTDDYSNPDILVQGFGDTASAPQTVSAPGWFEYRLPTPQPITEAGGVAVGWSIGTTGKFYIHTPGTSIDAISGFGNYTMALDGSALAMHYDSGTHHRGEFGAYDPSTHTISSTGWAFQGAWYGADIILRKKN